jgi:hypothetical protein
MVFQAVPPISVVLMMKITADTKVLGQSGDFLRNGNELFTGKLSMA